jgi:type II secretory ATPase GspE/PulE/Tfp pilus assembly ATPase PilB-like protein
MLSLIKNESYLPISNTSEIGEFKGLISGLYPLSAQPACLVLDMGCSEVIIVYSKNFLGSGAHLGLLSLLKSQRFLLTVLKELMTSDEIIKEIIHLSEIKMNSRKKTIVISESNKFIVLYDEIIAKAIQLCATDVHFEIRNSDFSNIRLRIAGRLKSWKRFPSELIRGCLTASYSARSKSGTNSAGSLSLERPMNTITEQLIDGYQINGRFNGFPLVNGYDVVIRLLHNDPKVKIPSITSLGYSDFHINNQIVPSITRNAGMMAIAGSTGSGKSTALRAFIATLPHIEALKIYGVEDPVEYLNPFMSQISIQRSSDDPDEVVKMKFLSALRSVLRMDPDVLMLGEIRDKESASLASEFNRTGHRVFTTVHGDGCVDVLSRLCSEEIGISSQTLAGKNFLSAVMYQKLLPQLCTFCKLPARHILSQSQIELLAQKYKLDIGKIFCANEHGCDHCKVEEVGMAGTKGLSIAAEILIPDKSILMAIAKEDWSGVERLWRGSRIETFDSPHMQGKTAFEHALYKASIGMIDPQDIETDFESLETYQIVPIE